ncbi:hypothetical protein CHUAL_013784 [Chamberlinius hualienensis]
MATSSKQVDAYKGVSWSDDANDKDDFDWSESYMADQGLRFSFSSSSTSPNDVMDVDVLGVTEWSPDKLNSSHDSSSDKGGHKLEIEFSYEFYLWNIDLEQKNHPKDILCNQPQVSADNRSALVGWLSRVYRSFDLFPETLFLAVNVLDRFLSSTPIALECLQLVGLAALFVSAKQLDVYHPTIPELIVLATVNYTRHHFLQMEKIVLNQLRFQLVVPTCVVFLDYYVQRQTDSSKKQSIFKKRTVYDLTRNILELCAQDFSLSRYAPSAMALGAMAVVEEYASGGPVDEPEIGHWDVAIVKQCTTSIWTYLNKILTVPLSTIATDSYFYQHLTLPPPQYT